MTFACRKLDFLCCYGSYSISSNFPCLIYYCTPPGEFQLPLNSVDLAGPIEEWKDLAPVDDGSNQYLGDLCLSLRYVPSSGKLTVAVLEARKLKKMDITGASDPYVKLKLFDSKVQIEFFSIHLRIMYLTNASDVSYIFLISIHNSRNYIYISPLEKYRNVFGYIKRLSNTA